MKHLASSVRFRPPCPKRGVPARGFTLIELMVTVSIAVILSTLVAPSMITMIRANRIQTEASSLIGDLQFARTEAVKRGQAVSVCPVANITSTTCLTTNVWAGGWLVFYDQAGNGVFDSSVDLPLRNGRPLRGGDTAAASTAPASNAITFNREGFAIGMGTTTTMFQFHTTDNNKQSTRCIAVDVGGRVTTLTYGNASMTGGTTCA